DLSGARQLLHHPGARHLDGGGVRRRRADRDRDQHLDRELSLDRDVHGGRRYLYSVDVSREPAAGGGRLVGFPRAGQGLLMLDRLAEEIPRFFSYYTVLFLLQAMGTTLLMTLLGCVRGFAVGFGIAVLRQTRGRL